MAIVWIVHILFNPFISWWICGLYPVFAIRNNAAIYIHGDTCLCENMVFSSLGYIPRRGISGLYGHLMFKFWGAAKEVSIAAATFYIPISNVWRFQFLHILASTYILPSFHLLSFFDYGQFSGCEITIVVLMYISLINDIEHLFMCYWPFSLEKLYSNSAYF